MSQDTTTISITDEQKDELESLKQHERESFKAVVDRLLKGQTSAEPMQVVPIEDVAGREVPQDQLNQDVMEQLERNYEAIKEATNAAQGAETLLEGMGGKR